MEKKPRSIQSTAPVKGLGEEAVPGMGHFMTYENPPGVKPAEVQTKASPIQPGFGQAPTSTKFDNAKKPWAPKGRKS